MTQRLTSRGRTAYNTASNQKRITRTPGNKLVTIKKDKKGKAPKCGQCGIRLLGVVAQRPAKFARLRKSQRRVSRAYGGAKCAKCVCGNIVDAFLDEEERIVAMKE